MFFSRFAETRTNLMKTVLITGASKGIGEAIARAFSANGYNVIINCFSSEEKAKTLLCDLLRLSEERVREGKPAFKAEIFKADVSDEKQVDEMFSYVFKKFGKIDVLVNNAGVALKQKVLQDISGDEFDKLVSVNLKGMFNCSKRVLDGMISAGEGRIINVSSIWGITGGSCETVYSMTKAGVIGFTKALAKEVALSSVAVNAVAPGLIDTDMNAGLSSEEKAAFCESVPAGRMGTKEDVASAVLLLANAPIYVTGQILGVDGGFC